MFTSVPCKLVLHPVARIPVMMIMMIMMVMMVMMVMMMMMAMMVMMVMTPPTGAPQYNQPG